MYITELAHVGRTLPICWTGLRCTSWRGQCTVTPGPSGCQEDWDIIISGGGVVGCAMACAIGSSPFLAEQRTLLLENGPPIQQRPVPEKYSNRVYAITPGSKELLSSFGAWERIENMRFKRVLRMQVWETNSDAAITFNYPSMENDIAYIVENDVIIQSLAQILGKANSRVTVRYKTKATKYEFPKEQTLDSLGSDGKVSVTLQDGTVLRTKLLIGADGIQSLVRKTMGKKFVSWDYGQKAIVATLKLSEAMANTVAWQRFLPTGPACLLPLNDELSSLVWTLPAELADTLMQTTEDSFVDALNKALWNNNKNALADKAVDTIDRALKWLWPEGRAIHQLPPSIISVEENSRASFPLGLGHATHYAAQGVALIGDAAHRVHPLAGQGVNLGLGDVRCLVQQLSASLYNGNDIGDLRPLLRYETERQRHILPIMCAIDALSRLYTTELTPVVVLRSVGLQLTNALKPVKERIIAYASS